MYGEEDLSSCPLFCGDYINWGFYDTIDLNDELTENLRISSSKRLYEVCASLLNLKRNDHFLEICCGKGKGMSLLKTAYSLENTEALDQSLFYLEQAKKINPDTNFLLGNFFEFDFKKKYNKILCIEAIQHFKDIEKTLEKFDSILDENGCCVIATFFGLHENSQDKLAPTIQTINSGIDRVHYIEDIKKKLAELDVLFEIFPVGQNVFRGFDKWTSQTSMKKSWTRNWLIAFEAGFIDYFIIKITKRKKISNLSDINFLIESYDSGNIEKYEFIRRMHRINKSLFYIQNRLKDTDLKEINISNKGISFKTRKDSLDIYFNGRDRRGAPFEILNFGNYEIDEELLLFSLIKDGDTIFDVGSNIGWYSLKFSKKFPNSCIHSFEPLPENAKVLEKNIVRNSASNVITNQLGLANFDGSDYFYYFPEGSVLSSRKNLLNYPDSEKIRCNLLTLDTYIKKNKIKRLDFIKCDVEGGELAFLEGALNTLTTHFPKLLLELCHRWTSSFGYHPNDIINFLSKLGYKCLHPEGEKWVCIENLDEEPKEEQLNFFFLHEKHHSSLIKKFL